MPRPPRLRERVPPGKSHGCFADDRVVHTRLFRGFRATDRGERCFRPQRPVLSLRTVLDGLQRSLSHERCGSRLTYLSFPYRDRDFRPEYPRAAPRQTGLRDWWWFRGEHYLWAIMATLCLMALAVSVLWWR